MSDPKQMLGELGRHDRSHSINCTFTPCDCGRHDELLAKIATALDCEKYHADGWEEADLECERLRAIIVAYGDHLFDCRGRALEVCTCGYLEALKALKAEKVRSCSVGGCDERAVVGVKFVADKEDYFQFCAKHDPRKAGKSSKLFVVIGGWMDYGDRSDVLVGVFDDEARANEVSRDALASTYDVTRLVPVDLNAVRTSKEAS